MRDGIVMALLIDRVHCLWALALLLLACVSLRYVAHADICMDTYSA